MPVRIAIVERQNARTGFWVCKVSEGPDVGKIIYLMPSEFDYSVVAPSDRVELTYRSDPTGAAGWIARKIP
jgi:hypothetical protein